MSAPREIMKKYFISPLLIIAFLLFSPAIVAAKDSAPMLPVIIEVTVPSDGWRLSISEIYIIDDEIWVISSLLKDKKAKKLGSNKVVLSDMVGVFSKELPIKYYVVSDSADVIDSNSDEINFVSSVEELEEDILFGRLLYSVHNESELNKKNPLMTQ